MRLQQFIEELVKGFVSLADLEEEAQQGTLQKQGNFWTPLPLLGVLDEQVSRSVECVLKEASILQGRL